MDFSDTPDEAAFRAEARAWIQKYAPRKWLDSGQQGMPEIAEGKGWQRLKAEHGWACIHWPREHGGRGATAIEREIWDQEEGPLWRLSPLFTIGHNMAGPTLMACASKALQARYLLPLIRGEEVWCQLFSEPGAGSDLAGIRTRAQRDGSDWLISGQKVWTSIAQYADFGLLLVRTDPHAPKHRGLTYFVIDMKAPGVDIRPIRQMSGMSEFNEVFLDEVRIPDAQRLGDVGAGWNVAMTTLANERAMGLTVFPPQVEEMLALARTTALDGVRAIDHAAVRTRIADWYITANGLKYTELRTLTRLSRGQQPGPESSIIKLIVGRGRQQLASFMLDVLGPSGAIMESNQVGHDALFQAVFLRAVGNRIEAGTDEIIRNQIAERILKLPGDLRIDKNIPFSEIPTAPTSCGNR
ncbi:MAG: acyl-CoA dehydrogenase family protein [Sinimarinibacterium sp.]|jgi:hypothetical protein